jgi:hypothetical protein
MSTILLDDRRTRRAKAFAALSPKVVSSEAELKKAFDDAVKNSVKHTWISYAPALTSALIKHATETHSKVLGAGLFAHSLTVRAIPALSSLFRRFAFQDDGAFIAAEDLAEVLHSDNCENLLIGGCVDNETKTITLWRGNLCPLIVPFDAFEKSGDGTEPDFDSFSITDCGQTVQLGKYEAAVDALLYEYDSRYRRTLAKKRLQDEQSFGASLRRLRKQRRLKREDFEPELSAKTVARIEQGKTERVHDKTRAKLAKRLAVKPEEIETF